MEPVITAGGRVAIFEQQQQQVEKVDQFDVWAITSSDRSPKFSQFACLTANKEAGIAHEVSSEDAKCYFTDIIRHEKFSQLAEHIVGDDLKRYVSLVLPYLENFSAAMTPENALQFCKEDIFQACYFPAGWGGNKSQFVVVKVQLVEGTTAHISILNRGRGSENHASVKDDPFLHELSSATFSIDLTSDLANQLFAEWRSLLVPKMGAIEISALDFYGRLEIFGEPVKAHEQSDAKRRISKEQYYSSSLASALSLMSADIFYTQGHSKDEFRRFSLVVKFFSLVQEFPHYVENENNRRIFKEAIEQTALRATKLGPELCNTARIHGYTVYMQKRMEEIGHSSLQALSSGTSFGAIQFPIRYFPHLNDTNRFMSGGVRQESDFFVSTIPETTNELTSILAKFINRSFCSDIRPYIGLRALFRSVHAKEFLKKSSSKEAEELIAALRTTLQRFPAIHGRQARQMLAELSLLALDMAAVCAEQIESLQFGNLYTLGLPLVTGHDASFQDPDALQSLAFVRQRFSDRSQGKKVLFQAKINLESGNEVVYLIKNIITEAVLNKFLEKNSGKETRASVIKSYFVNSDCLKDPLLPQELFTKPLRTLFSLLNTFAMSAGFFFENQNRFSYAHSGALDALEGTMQSKLRSLESELFEQRRADSHFLEDDRQNLVYSIKAEKDELASQKVGVIYKFYMQEKDEAELPEPLSRELCTLEAGRELRSLNTLDWLLRPNHFEHLTRKSVRDRLETLLFGPEAIDYAIQTSSRRVIEALFYFQQQYQNNAQNGELLEWCVSVVERFSLHLQRAGVKRQLLQQIESEPFLRTGQIEDSGARMRSLALCHLSRQERNTTQFVQDLIRAAYYQISLVEPTWPLLLGFSLSDPHFSSRADLMLAHPELLTQVANELTCNNDTYTWSLHQQHAHVVKGKSAKGVITFDLYTGESSSSQGSILDLLPHLKKQNQFLRFIGDRETLPVTVDGYNRAESIDGSFRFTVTKKDTFLSISELSMRFPINFDKTVSNWGTLQTTYISSDSDYKEFTSLTGYILKELLGHEDVDIWKFEGSELQYLFIDRKNPKVALLQNRALFQCVELIDGVWIKQDRQFSFISETKDPALNALIARTFPQVSFGHNRKISGCALLYEKGICTKVACPSLNFSFIRSQEMDVWLYDKDSEYKLMNQSSVQELGGYSRGIVLQHLRESKQKVLLTPVSLDGAQKALANRPFVASIKQGEIEGDTACHLYLSLIFRSQRKFTQAIHHLEKSKHLGVDGDVEEAIWNQITVSPINTTAGIAFDVHMLARAVEHLERFSEKFYKEGAEKIRQVLYKKVGEYRGIESRFREGVSGIPIQLVVPSWIITNYTKHFDSPTRLKWLEQGTARIHLDYRFDEMCYWMQKLKESEKEKARELVWSDATRLLTPTDLAQDFVSLARFAVSTKKLERALVKSYILSYLSHQDVTNFDRPLLTFLLYMLKDPDRFRAATTENSCVMCVLQASRALKEKEEIATLLSKREPTETKIAAPKVREPLLPRVQNFGWQRPVCTEIEFPKWPTQDLYERCFTEEKAFPYKDAYWPIAEWTSDDAMEMRLITSINSAFTKLQKRERSVHVPKKALVGDLSERKERIKNKLSSLEDAICRRLNTPQAEMAPQFFALRRSEQLGELSLKDAVGALLYNNNRLLLAKNPTLSQKDLSTIYSQTIEYLGRFVEYKQLEEIEEAIGDSYRLGEVLARKREYDPGEYPEILAYAAATGKEPTHAQTETLKKLFKSLSEAIDQKKIAHLLLEFAGGGGKTSLLIPILCMFLIRKGKIPCVSNTSELYYQSFDLLPAILKDAYNLQIELIDRDFEHLWTKEELEALQKRLTSWHKDEGKVILMKGSTWHSLNTQQKMHCYQYHTKNDHEAGGKMATIDAILAYFKEHGVLLEDECQDSSDPHEVTVRSFEFKEPVPPLHHEIYYEAYKLKGDLEASVQFFTKYSLFAGLDWLEEYIRSPLGTRHPSLLKLEETNKALSDLCILAKASIHLHMPYTRAFTLGKEFGDSLHPRDKTAAPRKDGRPTSAHFSDAMLVSLLTIQKAFEEGIRDIFIPEVALGIRDEYDQLLFKKEKISSIEEKLREIFGIDTFLLGQVSDSELEELLKAHKTNSWLVERYLKLHALPTIQFYGSAAKSTAAEMALGFTTSLRMSAFIGIPESYSVVIEKNEELLDTEFVAEVLAVLMERNRNGLIIENGATPKAFFEEIAEKVPENFAGMRAFFDRGIFANYSARELVEAASDVAAARGLKRHGITWEGEKTIRVASLLQSDLPGETIAGFPLRQTTGRDYPALAFTARCALFLHKNVTLSQLVQTVLRARKIRIPNAQTIFWCAKEELWKAISPDDPKFSVEKTIRWAIKNMASECKAKMIEQARQGIEAEVHAAAWKRVKKHSTDDVVHMVSTLCPSPSQRPWDLYDKPQGASGFDLRNYYYDLLLRIGLVDNNLSFESQKRISDTIGRTVGMVGGVDLAEKAALHQVGFHNHQQTVQMHVREERDLGADTRTRFERYDANDSLENEEKMCESVQRFTVPGIDQSKLPTFYIPSIERLSPRMDWKEAIKLLSHMLIFQANDGTWRFHVLTEAGARFYVQDMRKFHKVFYPELKAFVIGFGKTILNATFNITNEECHRMRDSIRFHRIVSLLTMMSNRTFNPHDFQHTIRELEWTRDDYRAFCKFIRKSLPQGDDFAPEKYEAELFSK